MFLNAIIFKKLEHVYTQLNNENLRRYLTFAPLSTVFTNNDFNFLNTSLAAAELSASYENKMAFATFANAIIRNPKIWNLVNYEFLPDSYKKIFENAIIIESSLSEEDKRIYREAKQLLFINENLDPTTDYSKYQEYKRRYADVTAELERIAELIMNNPGDTESVSKQQALQIKQSVILNDWLIEGNKEKIEKAEKTVYSSNPRSVFATNWRAESASIKSFPAVTTVNSDMEFSPVFCLPDNMYEYGYAGWKTIVLEENEVRSLTEEAKSWLGGDLYREFDDGSESITKIEFEYLYVSLLRNWFKPDLINSSFWCFQPENQDIVSDDTDPGKGLMPSFIDKFIFVRRVSAYNKIEKEEEAEVPSPNAKVFRFKDLAGIKNIREFKTVTPVEKPALKDRMISKENLIIKPVLMKTSLTNRNFRVNTIKRDVNSGKEPATKPGISRIVSAIRGRFRPDLGPPDHPDPLPPAPTHFNLTLVFKDNLGNPAGEITVEVINRSDGTSYSQETGNDGKVLLPQIPKGDYGISVNDEEIYEDLSSAVMVDRDMIHPLVLQKRANPRFNMFLIGAVNFRFPKLPNPVPGYNYS